MFSFQRFNAVVYLSVSRLPKICIGNKSFRTTAFAFSKVYKQDMF